MFLAFLCLQFFLAEKFLTPPKNDHLSMKTDAIIVFTGSANRVKTGFRLFEKKLAQSLYISGVNKKTSKGMILKKVNSTIKNEEKIFIDHAKNTEENVEYVSKWAKKNNISSIRLVTGFYHMKRALVMLTNKLPNVKIIPYSVTENRKTQRSTKKIISTLEEAIPELWHARYEFLKFQITYWLK